MNDERRLIDTNILVHAYVLADDRKHAIAKSIIQEIWNEGTGITTLQNVCEFFFVVTRKVKHPIPVHKARVVIERLINTPHWQVIDRDETTLYQAIQLVEQYNIPFWDALISACMLQNEIATILTEDVADFKKVQSIKAINPFGR